MGKKSKDKKAKPNLSVIFKSKMRGFCLFVGALILGIGIPKMIAGHEYAPWLIASGMFLASLVIITDDDIQRVISNLIGSRLVRIILYLLVCLLFTIVPFLLASSYSNNQRAILTRNPVYYGYLTPENEPTPLFPSFPKSPDIVMPTDSFIVMLGDDSGIFINGRVDNTFYLKQNPFLTIKTKDDGSVIFNTEVIDGTNHEIIKAINNEFRASQEFAFNPWQLNKHSLIVRDSEGVEVLNIKYINSRVLWISGRFYSPKDSQVISISPSGVIDLCYMKMGGIYTTLETGEKMFLGQPPTEYWTPPTQELK